MDPKFYFLVEVVRAGGVVTQAWLESLDRATLLQVLTELQAGRVRTPRRALARAFAAFCPSSSPPRPLSGVAG